MPRVFQLYEGTSVEKKPFEPIQPGHVGLYVCGMTVYDLCHLGHGRVMVAFDVVVRFLRAAGYTVHYIRNITDVDDKIIRRAQETGQTWQALSQHYIDEMHQDEAALSVLSPDQEPKASDHIPQMIEMIQTLMAKGHAYIGDQGDVLFSVATCPTYGKLSGQKLDCMRANARKSIEEGKRDVLDFVLWKMAKPGEPSWSSPWGEGRPGWHIECSAMSTNLLGFTLDIHGGGIDLKFPHHENEIAQSECTYHNDFVNHWMHVGHVQVDRVKMSKSLNNFFTIRELLKQFSGETLRYTLLSSHYRSPMQFSIDALDQGHAALTRFYRVLDAVPPCEERANSVYVEQFFEVMSDDFNTPKALAVCFDLVRHIYVLTETDQQAAAHHAADLRHMLSILGLGHTAPSVFLKGVVDVDEGFVTETIAKREAARQNRDWATADQLRDALLEQGIMLEDRAGKTLWRKA